MGSSACLQPGQLIGTSTEALKPSEHVALMTTDGILRNRSSGIGATTIALPVHGYVDDLFGILRHSSPDSNDTYNGNLEIQSEHI